nr:PhoX family phosphatase [uncultured Rhodopila sp.]
MSDTPRGQSEATVEHGDEPLSNHSNNPFFADIVAQRIGRRTVFRGGLAAAVTGMFGACMPGLSRPALADAAWPEDETGPQIGFAPVPVAELDKIVVPPGYSAKVLVPWGEPIAGAMPAFSLSNSGADQALQIGQHHDGLHFFPIEGQSPFVGSSRDGLLVLNHEYIEPRYMHRSATGKPLTRNDVPMAGKARDDDEVLKELNAHGVAIVRIRQGADGTWSVARDERNRRITGLTAMEFAGPARGSDLLKTKFSPTGERGRGTLNNCAHGVTPWNTYLTAEENWAGYFVNHDEELPREHKRYGVATRESRYRWELAAGGKDEYVRFDASAKAGSAAADYRNEPNAFGWIVEIDPFNPAHQPVKRTALGRFAHEGVIFAKPVAGKPLVCYSGDDARFEYIYKFVSAAAYDPATADGRLLDDGRLYVARFNNDGTGEWLPLVHNEGKLTAANGFADQAEVLINTRTAADVQGATKMDRPEWGAIDPKNGQVYFTLTNNSRRTAEQTNPPNPRPDNLFGQIIRWVELESDPAATRFNWDLFVIAGPEHDSRTLSGAALDKHSIFACPDGLWFDKDGRLWVQTDIGEDSMNVGPLAQFGNNAMLCANPVSGEILRFLTGPFGQEITGVVTTPDQRTMFINVQHPGATTSAADFAAGKINSSWPDHDGTVPRSATVVITKDDGGVIGA